MKTKVQVKDLQVGDKLGSGGEILVRPFTDSRCQPGRVNVGVKYPNGAAKFQVWGKYTTVTVLNR